MYKQNKSEKPFNLAAQRMKQLEGLDEIYYILSAGTVANNILTNRKLTNLQAYEAEVEKSIIFNE